MPSSQLNLCGFIQLRMMSNEFAFWGVSDGEVNSYFGSFGDLCVVDAPDVFDDAGKPSCG